MFIRKAETTTSEIQALGTKLEEDLRSLLSYFGEKMDGLEGTRPDEFFGMMLGFSLALQKAAAEVTVHLAPGFLKPDKKVCRYSLCCSVSSRTHLTLFINETAWSTFRWKASFQCPSTQSGFQYACAPSNRGFWRTRRCHSISPRRSTA